jgi:hypothetical protein
VVNACRQKKKRGEGKATIETHEMRDFRLHVEELIAALSVLKEAPGENDRWRRWLLRFVSTYAIIPSAAMEGSDRQEGLRR